MKTEKQATKIRVGLTKNNLSGLGHALLEVAAIGTADLSYWQDRKSGTYPVQIGELKDGQHLKLKAEGNRLRLYHWNASQSTLDPGCWLVLKSTSPSSGIRIDSLNRFCKSTLQNMQELEIFAINGEVHVNLVCLLEDYLKGVLFGEVPASYHLEAIKAQTVTARTYALNPRIDHSADYCNVCDSYLCCQCFEGIPKTLSPTYTKAIESTADEILVYENKPILALFSACAGGHTENYENCFSDPKTNAFPPASIPYLKGVEEGILPFSSKALGSEDAIRSLFNAYHPDTCDAWSPNFRWTIQLSGSELEGQMHHVIEMLMQDPESAPWIIPPKNGTFGHIHSFKISERGIAGTAMLLEINTSTGTWSIKKELVIRKAFHNTEAGLRLLKSARFFIKHQYDPLGLLKTITIHGLGSGHGVGLQQTGAQGLANRGKNYRTILSHYFMNAQIART